MKKILLSISISLALLLCCACGTGAKAVFFLEDAVFMDAQNPVSTKFVVCFNYLYQGNKPTIQLTNIKGEGLEGISYTCEDATSDFQNNEYRGYKMGAVCIEILYDENSIGKTMVMEDMVFMVDDKEKALELKYPLKYTPVSPDTNTGIISVAQATNGCGAESDVIYAYTAMEDIILEGISLGKYFELKDMTISIDKGTTGEDELVGNADAFPLKVEKGETFVIRGTLFSDYYTGYQIFYTTAIISYASKGIKYKEHSNLLVDSLADEGMVHDAIDYILDNNLI